MKRIKLRKQKSKYYKLKWLMWIVIVTIIFAFSLIQLISKKINPIIYRYATVETKRFTKALINSAIDDDIIENIGDNLFEITKSSAGDIQTIDFDAKEVNKILNLISEKIEDKLLLMEEGDVSELKVSRALKGMNFDKLKKGIVCEIPVGVLFGNSLFTNMGPSIPVRLSFIGQVTTNLKTKVETYGINNAYLELYVHIEIEERISMPMMVEEEKVKLDVPLTMKVIQGKVPTYFQDGINKDSSLFTLPVE